ncbi:unnamed protein product [Notodromas monacha]|uniref:USP domain-containing protein n=1 Tax=Notodromas monacha TaxID=399045 RepID=A0A7R9BMZ9_9CRUS|nr:unnamed protein product [Notodromas monacha]CAG0918168.1 unnamed protein product [Notodromas monacha]
MVTGMAGVLPKFAEQSDESVEITWNVFMKKYSGGFGALPENEAAAKVAIDWLLSSPRPVLRRIGKEILTICVASERVLVDDAASSSLSNLFGGRVWREDQGDSVIYAGIEYVEFLHFYLRMFRDGGSEKWVDNCAIVRKNVCTFLEAKNGDLALVQQVSEMLLEYPECLPRGTEAERLCALIIRFLSAVPAPKSVEFIAQFSAAVNHSMEIRQLLSFTWSQPEMGYLKTDCLRTVCDIITTEDASRDPPSSVLSLVLDLFVQYGSIPNSAIEAMKSVMRGGRCRGFIKLRTALNNMLEWLLQSQKSSTLAQWIERVIMFIKMDKSLGKPIMDDVARIWPAKFSQRIQVIVEDTRTDLGESRQEMMAEVAGLIKDFSERFRSHDDVCESLYDCLKANGYRDDQDAAGSPLGVFGPLTLQELSSQNRMGSGMVQYVAPKSSTGKVGLVNLGNTCYMNSVLQALYMTDAFRERVLDSGPAVGQALAELRVVFAFLVGTDRAAYAPSQFLRVCNPPWFETGLQQDCSEFLQYLFDTLHREEQEEDRRKFVEVDGCAKELPTSGTRVSDETEPIQVDADLDENEEEGVVAMDDDVDDEDKGDGVGLTRWRTEENLNNQQIMCRPESLCKATVMIADTDIMVASSSAATAGFASGSHDSGIHSVGDDDNPGTSIAPVDDEEQQQDGTGPDVKEEMIMSFLLADTLDSSNQNPSDLRQSRPKRKKTEPETSDPSPLRKTEADRKTCEVSRMSLVDYIFGGVMEHVTRCLTCGAESKVVEQFRDLGVPCDDDGEETKMEEDRGGDADNKTVAKTNRLNLTDLLLSTLAPERLDGENRYFCDTCRQLRDAERSARITRAPWHLMLVIKRFAYNKELQRKLKISRDVYCPDRLNIPLEMLEASEDDACGGRKQVLYRLYAAVIHSGTNSDSGHYYCYARHQRKLGETLGGSGDDEPWYLLNDSRVMQTDYESFRDLTQKHKQDTAYLLLYQRVALLDHGVTGSSVVESWDQVVPPDLRDTVELDNRLVKNEREAYEKQLACPWKGDSGDWGRNNKNPKDQDDDGESGNGAFRFDQNSGFPVY